MGAIARIAKPARNIRVLSLDIETSPNLAFVWGMFKQNISLPQLQETSKVMCWAGKWYGEKGTIFHSDHTDGHEAMIRAAHDAINEADVIVHYNGTSFDMPNLHKEFLLAGLNPPSPYKNVDLLKTVRKQFRFSSSKLDHVSQQLGLGSKTSHTGFQLWLDAMAGDEKAWKLFEKYNRNDVVLTEKLYDKLRPWIKDHPHLGQIAGIEHSCPACGSDKLERVAKVHANVTSYRGYTCTNCGMAIRGTAKLQEATRTRAAR